MNGMGSVGTFYVMLLIFIIVAGTGVIAYNLSQKYLVRVEETIGKWGGKDDKLGGKTPNKWLRLAAVSFSGLVLASFSLGLLNTTSGQDAHSAHSGARSQQILPASNPVGTNDINAQIYNIQMTMMQMQEQFNHVTQMYGTTR